jgi:hypothetical protein
MSKVYIAVLMILAYIIQLSRSEQCSTNKLNPCIANCNGTIFDISKAFKFPYNISDDIMWCPCSGCKCADSDLAAVCQYGQDCGRYQDPVFILEQTNPYMFSIEYPSGPYYRISIFRFIVSKAYPDPQVIGQPGCRISGPNPFK